MKSPLACRLIAIPLKPAPHPLLQTPWVAKANRRPLGCAPHNSHVSLYYSSTFVAWAETNHTLHSQPRSFNQLRSASARPSDLRLPSSHSVSLCLEPALDCLDQLGSLVSSHLGLELGAGFGLATVEWEHVGRTSAFRFQWSKFSSRRVHRQFCTANIASRRIRTRFSPARALACTAEVHTRPLDDVITTARHLCHASSRRCFAAAKAADAFASSPFRSCRCL